MPLTLDVDAAHDEVSEGRDGRTEVRLRIPFTGTASLWDASPSKSYSTLLHGDASVGRPGKGATNFVTFIYSEVGANAEHYKRWRTAKVDQLQKWIEFVNTDVTHQYGVMSHTIERAIAERRARLEELENSKKKSVDPST